MFGAITLCGVLVAAKLSLAQTKPSYRYTGELSLDLHRVPFSRFGSYMTFSMLTDMSSATPTLLRLTASGGDAEIYFDAADRIRFRTHGVSLRLTPVGKEVTVPKTNSHWEMFRQSGPGEKYTVWPQVGKLEMAGSWNGIETDNPTAVFSPDPASHISEGEIDTYDSVWTPPIKSTSFESGLSSVRDEYQRWLTRMPEVSPELGPGAELAAYVNWSAVVAPKDFLDRPTMLMSKNWMAMVWSWDHCFNAMALAEKDPELAWQQYRVLFDNQEVHGALPDGLRETIREFTYSKPPIHGWVLAWMMRHGDFSDRKHLEEAYGPLVKWTEWYFRYRDSNHNGLPEYNQGNDSGWDNSTVFLKGVPVEAPDLSSFLVLQMNTLATMAQKLGKQAEATEWRKRSATLLEQMLARFWKDDHFVAIRTQDDSVVESESLLLYIPIVLGNELPPAVQRKLIEGLTRQGRFRTAHGLATEAIHSPTYTPDGYWRGPIWAPSSMLIADGLDSMGRKQLAHDLRVDFCNMAQKSGMSENYDAHTGAALRDSAYTWTSSVYLMFAHELWQGSR